MKNNFLPIEHPVRDQFRSWLRNNPNPSSLDLAKAGYVAPHWPKPWGLSADPLEQLIIEDELKNAGIKRPSNPIGIGWAGPTLIHAGSEWQKERYLMPILSGEEIWCQLFSEPEAGSDLASLKTFAVQDGDEFVVSGEKIWTSLAHFARFGILLAKTDKERKKHESISYFILDMTSPGVEITPIVDMTGMHSFNSVFLNNVRIPLHNLVGELNDGWKLAKITLQNERVSLSSGGLLWGNGPTTADIVNTVKSSNFRLDELQKDRLMRIYTVGRLIDFLTLRQVTSSLGGKPSPIFSSLRKSITDEHAKNVFNYLTQLCGYYGSVIDDPNCDYFSKFLKPKELNLYFLFSRALSIGGGTSEVQKNIIAEKMLGLPKEIDLS